MASISRRRSSWLMIPRVPPCSMAVAGLLIGDGGFGGVHPDVERLVGILVDRHQQSVAVAVECIRDSRLDLLRGLMHRSLSLLRALVRHAFLTAARFWGSFRLSHSISIYFRLVGGRLRLDNFVAVNVLIRVQGIEQSTFHLRLVVRPDGGTSDLSAPSDAATPDERGCRLPRWLSRHASRCRQKGIAHLESGASIMASCPHRCKSQDGQREASHSIRSSSATCDARKQFFWSATFPSPLSWNGTIVSARPVRSSIDCDA